MAQSLIPASPFLGGLNTELNKLVDSTDFTQDELNFTIRANNTRARRLGIDYEELYKFNRELIDTTIPNLAFACTEWTDINSPDESEQYETPLIVCQIGGTLIFFRNYGAPFSGDQADFTLDLKEYALDPEKTDYMTEVCSFSAAYGCLFVSSKALKPFYLRAAQEEQTVVPEDKPQFLKLNCSIENSKKGRAGGDGYWKMYINGIQIGQVTMREYYGSAWTGQYWANFQLTSTQVAEAWNKIDSETRMGIIATPKYPDAYPTRWGMRTESGIINEIEQKNTKPDDWILFEAPEGSGDSLKGVEIKLISGAYYKVSDGGSWYDVPFYGKLAGGTTYENSDGLTLRIRDTIGVQDYLPIDNSPTKLSYAHLYNLLNQGWTVQLIADFYKAQTPKVFPANNIAQFYLKDQKTEKFKPDALINTTFGNTPAAKGHFILDFFNQDRLNASATAQAMSNLANLLGVSVDDILDKNVPNPTDPELQIPVVKPRKNYVASSCAYAGRIFYLCGDVLLYSQIISEDIVKANKCYTDADPTSEEISDIIETDGGMISLPEIGEGVKLTQVGSYLFVFGTRDVFAISGTANNIFTATAYSAGGVSAIPSQAPQSFVETEYGVFYWGLSGINLLAAGEGGIQVQDLSTNTILTFYGKLTNIQQKHCKGVYSSSRKRIYWFYPSNDNKPRQLDMCLAFDIQRNAFMPFKVSSQPTAEEYEGLDNYPEIVSATEIRVPFVESHEYPIYAETIIPEDIKEVTAYQYKTILDGAETFVYSKEPFEFYYEDKECTKQLGPFEDLYGVEGIPSNPYEFSLKVSDLEEHYGDLVSNSSSSILLSYSSKAIKISTDFGETWTNSSQVFSASIGGISFIPSQNKFLCVLRDATYWESSDGLSWSKVEFSNQPNKPYAMEPAPFYGDKIILSASDQWRVYVATYSNGAITDAVLVEDISGEGKNWSTVQHQGVVYALQASHKTINRIRGDSLQGEEIPYPDETNTQGKSLFSIENVLYLIGYNGSGANIYASTDAGSNWSIVGQLDEDRNMASIPLVRHNKEWYTIRGESSENDTGLLVGSSDLSHWTPLARLPYNASWGTIISVSNGVLFQASTVERGLTLWKTPYGNVPGDLLWSQQGTATIPNSITAAGYNPRSGVVLVNSTELGSTTSFYRSLDNGASWQSDPDRPTTNQLKWFEDPFNCFIIYGTDRTFYTSTDGISWTTGTTLPSSVATTGEFAGIFKDAVYFKVSGKVYKNSLDNPGEFTVLENFANVPSSSSAAIISTDEVQALVFLPYASPNAALKFIVSTDGETTQEITSDYIRDASNVFMRSINNKLVLFNTDKTNVVYVSTDFGATFTETPVNISGTAQWILSDFTSSYWSSADFYQIDSTKFPIMVEFGGQVSSTLYGPYLAISEDGVNYTTLPRPGAQGTGVYVCADTAVISWEQPSSGGNQTWIGFLAPKSTSSISNTLVIRRYMNWTRQEIGADHISVATPWIDSLGVSKEVFIVPEKEAKYPSGTKTAADDPNLYTTVDHKAYVNDYGQISYNYPKLTEETKDQAPLIEYNVTYTGLSRGSQEVVDDEGCKVLADTPLDTEEFTYESSTLLCLDPAQGRVTFGNFRNNALKDWAEGDTEGTGYSYQSYLISHPSNAQDFVRNKTMPYLIGYFKRTEVGKDLTNRWIYGSKCQGSVLWDWRTNGDHSKWDSPQELYRPNPRTILSEGYIITKTNIRGMGRAFQIKLESVEDNQIIIESLCFNLQGDSRI